jgi:undecaprenyl-diphosphatase
MIQGLTEFLPVSSTAHLTLMGKLLGFVDPQHPETWTAFIAVMQLGTLAAVVMYFWRDIISMVVSLWKDVMTGGFGEGLKGYSADSRLAICIVVGTLPVALIGFGLRHVIEGTLTKSTMVIASSLIILALLLWLAEKVSRHTRTFEQITWRDALVVGVAQALALIPGSSRSGTTITAALYLGITRTAAARFSFLLSIPAVFASGLFEMARINASIFQLGIPSLVIATLVSALAGYGAIAWLLRYLMKNTTMVFVWYRFALGILLFVLLAAGIVGQ